MALKFFHRSQKIKFVVSLEAHLGRCLYPVSGVQVDGSTKPVLEPLHCGPLKSLYLTKSAASNTHTDLRNVM